MYLIGVCVGPCVGLRTSKERRILCSCSKYNPNYLLFDPYPLHYTDRIISVPVLYFSSKFLFWSLLKLFMKCWVVWHFVFGYSVLFFNFTLQVFVPFHPRGYVMHHNAYEGLLTVYPFGTEVLHLNFSTLCM
jgi:hypothetical protein